MRCGGDLRALGTQALNYGNGKRRSLYRISARAEFIYKYKGIFAGFFRMAIIFTICAEKVERLC